MAQFYQYGFVEPNRTSISEPKIPKEPILYQYIPPGQNAAEPPAPPPPSNTSATPTVHFGMTQQFYGSVPIVQRPVSFYLSQQQAHVQYVPQPQAYQPPARMAPVAQASPGAVPWVGATRAEIDAQNIAIAKATGATRPQSMIPYKPADGQQWWCREIDGSYTLRTTNDIMENLQPGKWVYSSTGFPYFVRQPAT
ncbi:predicted protein [Uncinocarpus reesii 1704]|uniref:Uncharacterized protein n=1 Tax=Uncinocarpus reesii (strain UAMH 1704) TaxID=336963 RepID=C4JM59_UNCRE|nr:uncharacterized protein UREG_03917 [Uncinocarpus reesii 1704]EEP79071.1 predicted protein [Uncinocarpus reesii 1704]